MPDHATSLDDRASKIRLAPDPVRRGRGRPALREITDYGGAQPAVLLTVPDQYAYDVMAALRTAWRDGLENAGDERYDDPRWWSSECSRCCGVEWHRAGCREAEDAEHEPPQCERCEVTVVSYRAEAATAPGPWHEPGCPLYITRSPDAADVIEVHGHLAESAFRRIGEMLSEHLGRHKAYSTHYVFGPMNAERADAVCAYLQDLGITHDRETTTRWTAGSGP
jgi:hypothetical protein